MIAKSEIAHHRLYNQDITHAAADGPSGVVNHLGAVQSQDYLGALWGIGLRTGNDTEAEIERAIAKRSIVRTWAMRGTLHFLAAADIYWMLDLIGPRMIARMAGRYSQLGLDEDTFKRSRGLIVKALQQNHSLRRKDLFELLESAGIATVGQRGIHILQRLTQEGLLCFGERQGKQFTFVLLPEWIPPGKTMTSDQSLAELAMRYFTSRGPALLDDFVWWSGLATSEARAALEVVKPNLISLDIDGQNYWMPYAAPDSDKSPAIAHLLPAFDEYLVGYRDRSAILDAQYILQTNAGGGMLSPTILINGQVVGTWKREFRKGSVVIRPDWFTQPSQAYKEALSTAAQRYSSFLRLPASLA